MYKIRVALGPRSYPIYIGSGLVDKLKNHLPKMGKIVLVTTPVINEHYGSKIEKNIGDLELILVPDGEEAKEWNILEELIGTLIKNGLDRKSTIIALGGGSVGDLAGFTASIYMRGINVIHIPTTLLSMVDSSIGGKTAINHPKGKNLVGSFHQPIKVLIDPLFLNTLPDREIQSGMAEVIKYGIISDYELFQLIEEKNLKDFTIKDKIEIIQRCVATKAQYVEQDEEDNKGIRAALNLGHTLGHAVEKLTNHSVNHGEGVSIGMVAAAWISKENKHISESDYNKVNRILDVYRLPTQIPKLDIMKLLEIMHRDKKAEAGKIRFVLPTGIGKKPLLKYVNDRVVIRMLERLS